MKKKHFHSRTHSIAASRFSFVRQGGLVQSIYIYVLCVCHPVRAHRHPAVVRGEEVPPQRLIALTQISSLPRLTSPRMRVGRETPIDSRAQRHDATQRTQAPLRAAHHHCRLPHWESSALASPRTMEATERRAQGNIIPSRARKASPLAAADTPPSGLKADRVEDRKAKQTTRRRS